MAAQSYWKETHTQLAHIQSIEYKQKYGWQKNGQTKYQKIGQNNNAFNYIKIAFVSNDVHKNQ